MFSDYPIPNFTGKSIARALLYLTWGGKAKQMPADYFSWE